MRKKGQDVWVFRWRNTHADGSRKETTRLIATVLEYRTKAAAIKAAEALRIDIKSASPRPSVFGMTFGQLVEHYIVKELDINHDEIERAKAYSTIEANRTQEPPGHANGKTTLDLYAKAVTPSKRRAHQRIVDQLRVRQQKLQTPDRDVSCQKFSSCLLKRMLRKRDFGNSSLDSEPRIYSLIVAGEHGEHCI